MVLPRCVECSSTDLKWKETCVERDDNAGIARARSNTRDKSRTLRDQLKTALEHTNKPVWIAVQNRGEDDPDNYWIGKATGIKTEHIKDGYVVGVTNRRERYDAGDFQFEVQWYERDVSGGEERRIFKAGDPGAFTFNSSELRMINVEMSWVPPVGGAPLNIVQQRPPTRNAAKKATTLFRNILRPFQAVIADPPEALWEISTGSEALILQWCCP